MNTDRKMWPWRIFAAAILAMGWLGMAHAGEPETGAGKPPMGMDSGAVKVTLEGTNFCLGCALRSKKRAGAQCGVLGHKHAFKVGRAVDAEGKELADLKGWVLHYLDTEKSQELITKHHGEKLTLMGIVYPFERVMEVTGFEKTAPSKG